MKKLLAAILAALLLSGCAALAELEKTVTDTLLRYSNRGNAKTELNLGGALGFAGVGEALGRKGFSLPEETPAPQPPAVASAHTPLPRSAYYGYRLLGEQERVVYDRLTQAIEECRNFISIEDIPLTHADLNRVFQHMVLDNPQFFYLSKYYQYRYFSNDAEHPVVIILHYYDGQVADAIDGDYQRTATADRERIYAQRAELNRRVSEVLKSIPADADPLQKEKLAHDYVVSATRYDHDAAGAFTAGEQIAEDSHAFSCYGVFLEGVAVCEGYSEALQYLLTQMGIECLLVLGESENQPHQWNLVKIGEHYYHVDPTWNDAEVFEELGMSGYYYLNMSDTMIAADHIVGISNGEGQYYGYPLPRSDSSDAYYYNTAALQVGADGSVLNDATAVIGAMAQAQEPYLAVLFPRDAGEAFIKNWLQSTFWQWSGPMVSAFTDGGARAGVAVAPDEVYYLLEKWGMVLVPVLYGGE